MYKDGYCWRLGDILFGPSELHLVLRASSPTFFMRLRTTFSFVAVILLILTCFLPWLRVSGRGLMFRGVDEIKMVVGGAVTKEINWGRPAYFHLFWAVFFLLFLFIKNGWARWALLGAAAFNMAWTVRNFFLLPLCSGSIDCPEKATGLYLLPLAGVLLFIAASLSDGKAMNSKK